MREDIKIGLLGFGTVGGGTARILIEQAERLGKRCGVPVRLVRICDRNPNDKKGLSLPEGVLTDDVEAILADADIDIFVELIGGIEPARSFILRAIEQGKHVVTANKALLATHGREIFQAAARKGVTIGFEASVGGGIPVIKTVKEGLVANRLHTVVGIMNGTSNYILSRMTEEGLPFDEVLAEAQRLGYAEADPTYDVEGVDAGHKLAIMATLAFGVPVGFEDVYTEGISRLTPLDIAFAAELGYRIKLLAIARDHGHGLELRVHPTMIPTDHLLAQVRGAYNAFYLIGDAVGKILLYGLGAGQMPTGSAVVADIIDIARGIAQESRHCIPSLGVPFEALGTLRRSPMEDLAGRYYFRFSAADHPGVLSRISGILAQYHISIASVVQKGRGRSVSVPIVMLTHEAQEAMVRQALTEIDGLDVVSDATVVIRIEDLKALEESEG